VHDLKVSRARYLAGRAGTRTSVVTAYHPANVTGQLLPFEAGV